MSSRKARSIFAAIAGAVFGLASISQLSSPAQAADLDCNSGSYNTRITTSGACAWGNVTTSTSGTIYKKNINMVLVDNASDGTYAAFDVHQCTSVSCTSYTRLATTNGYNTSTPVQKVIDQGNGIRTEIRVCASGSSCSGWTRI